jgi:hypothetical protein
MSDQKVPTLSKEEPDLKDYQRKLIAALSDLGLVDAVKSVFLGVKPYYLDASRDSELSSSKLDKKLEKREAFANQRFQLTYILSERALSKELKIELANRSDFTAAIDSSNPETLWNIIREQHEKTDTAQNKALSLVHAKKNFANFHQEDEDIRIFNSKFKGHMEKLTKLGGIFAAHDCPADEVELQQIAEYLSRLQPNLQSVILPAFHGKTLSSALNT